jgi:hypothetical protein
MGGRDVESTGATSYNVSNGSAEQNLNTAMAVANGTAKQDLYDDQGNVSGKVYEYNGQQIAATMDEIDNAQSTISNHIEQSMSNGGSGISMQQDVTQFKAGITGGRNVSDTHTDLSGLSYPKAIANAAMITSIGQDVSKETGMEGSYRIGGHTYTTGMSKQQATDILQSRGISGIEMHKDSAGSDTYFTYQQQAVSDKSSILRETKHDKDGHALAIFSAGIGKKNGPSKAEAIANNGLRLSFENKAQAARYFNATGNIEMATAVSNTHTGASDKVGDYTTLTDNGSKGFTVELDGKEMFKHGMRVGVAENGEDIITRSNDAHVKDPFAVKKTEQPAGYEGNSTSWWGSELGEW